MKASQNVAQHPIKQVFTSKTAKWYSRLSSWHCSVFKARLTSGSHALAEITEFSQKSKLNAHLGFIFVFRACCWKASRMDRVLNWKHFISGIGSSQRVAFDQIFRRKFIGFSVQEYPTMVNPPQAALTYKVELIRTQSKVKMKRRTSVWLQRNFLHMSRNIHKKFREWERTNSSASVVSERSHKKKQWDENGIS